MGGSSYSGQAAQNIRSSNQTKSANQIFKQNAARAIAPEMSPVGLKFRESRDSDNHPESLAIMVWLDGTGSMGEIPLYLIKNTLPTLMEVIIKHGTPHPHVLFGGIGDKNDDAPVQVGQFEAGAEELNTCLSKVWLEGDGKGNQHEAYSLAHFIAARHTSIDCFEKRGMKGILFTIGDEMTEGISADLMRQITGDPEAQALDPEKILAEAERLYHCFHIHVDEGSYPESQYPGTVGSWRKLMPERVIVLKDKKQLAEVMGTTIALMHGADMQDIVKDFDAKTAEGVTTALAHISTNLQRGTSQTGVAQI